MDIIIFVGILIVISIISNIKKAVYWIKFKNKYPILSDELPDEILSVGDKVFISKIEFEFLGISTYDGLWYVFMPENSVTPVSYTDGCLQQIDAVYGRYGLKWKRIKS